MIYKPLLCILNSYNVVAELRLDRAKYGTFAAIKARILKFFYHLPSFKHQNSTSLFD